MTGDSTTAVAPARRPEPAAYDEWFERRWRFASLSLVLLLVAIGGTVLMTGEKESTYGDLVGAVVDGEVQQVEVSGQRSGSRTVVLRWSRTVDHYAEVRVARGQQDPRDVLLAIRPSLVVEDHRLPRSSSSYMLAGWRGPFVLWWMSLVAVIWVFVLIVSGPRPWRATRWAWFWLFALASPIGLVAYVVLAGPLGRPQPADPSRRRLTGGWAFLLAWLVLGSLIGAARTHQ